MALRIAAMAALVLVLCSSFYHSAEATEYSLGENFYWELNVDYDAWASTKTFHVGDTLVFYYEGEMHNVVEVQKSAYDSCDTSNPIQEFGGGYDRISLSSAGTKYFIFGVPDHCDSDVKVAVTVSPTATPTTSPSPRRRFSR